MIVDIHTHILPGVDDGARTLADSLAMARIAVADGITHMVATPHHRDYVELTQPELVERVAELQLELVAARIPLTLIAGREIRLYDNMFDDWDQGRAGPLGESRYVLAEPLFSWYDAHTDEMLFELFDRGYRPIMAHPERIRPIQENLALIEPFLERGGLTQITAGSLSGVYNWRAKETAMEMLRRGMAHIIASDAHNTRRRTPILRDAVEIAARVVGPAEAEAMISTTPRVVITDELITTQLQG